MWCRSWTPAEARDVPEVANGTVEMYHTNAEIGRAIYALTYPGFIFVFPDSRRLVYAYAAVIEVYRGGAKIEKSSILPAPDTGCYW